MAPWQKLAGLAPKGVLLQQVKCRLSILGHGLRSSPRPGAGAADDAK